MRNDLVTIVEIVIFLVIVTRIKDRGQDLTVENVHGDVHDPEAVTDISDPEVGHVIEVLDLMEGQVKISRSRVDPEVVRTAEKRWAQYDPERCTILIEEKVTVIHLTVEMDVKDEVVTEEVLMFRRMQRKC